MNIENIQPGDWYVAENGFMVLSKGGGEYSFLVAECRYRDAAVLISAAPDLLKTLREIDQVVDTGSGIKISKGSPFHMALQEAIKKATTI